MLQAVPWEEENDPNLSLWLLTTLARSPHGPHPLKEQKCRRIPKVLHKVQVHVVIQLAFIKPSFTNIDLLI